MVKRKVNANVHCEMSVCVFLPCCRCLHHQTAAAVVSWLFHSGCSGAQYSGGNCNGGSCSGDTRCSKWPR